MEFQIYTVRDICAGTFTKLEIMTNEAVARRWFRAICAESKFPADLELFRLGTYDSQTGVINSNVEFIEGGAIDGKE